jgi:O-antigen ligase
MLQIFPARENLRQFVYWTLLIFLAGFYFFPQSKLHNTAYYGLVLLPFLLSLRRQDIVGYWQSSVFRLAIIFLGYLTLSLAWGEQTTINDWVKYSKRLLYMLGFACMIMAYYSPQYLHKLCKVIASVAVVMAVVSMLLYDSSLYPPPDRLKNFGILEHEILSASTYGFAAIMLLYGCQFDHPHQRWIKLIGMAILMMDMVLTQSRGPFLALIGTICIAELLSEKYRKPITGFIIVAIMAGVLMAVDVIETPAFISRNGGDTYRLQIWQYIWQRIMDSPWYGLGLSTNETIAFPACSCIPHPHNFFLATMFYGGVIGLLMLLLLLTHSLYIAYRHYQYSGQVKFLAFLLFGIICGLTDGNKLIDHPRPMWLYFWLPILVIAAQQVTENLQQPANRSN